MITMYGSPICGDCRDAVELFQQKGFTDYNYVVITESTANLREFLHLRDTRVELGPVRAQGNIGIPCFVREDGSLTMDPQKVLEEAGLGC